jgi:hypothetical protein
VKNAEFLGAGKVINLLSGGNRGIREPAKTYPRQKKTGIKRVRKIVGLWSIAYQQD